jgi:hypothetical protein
VAKVEGFWSADSQGRKAYRKGRVIKCVVEFGSLTLDSLMNSLSIELESAPNQSVIISFFDKRRNEDVNLIDEIQMLDLFDMYKEEMACQVAIRVVELATVGDDVDLEADDVHDVELEADHLVGDDVEADREPDMFDNEEEYVGIDDESIYIPVPPSNTQPSTNAQLNDNVPLLIMLMMLLLKEIFFWRKR